MYILVVSSSISIDTCLMSRWHCLSEARHWSNWPTTRSSYRPIPRVCSDLNRSSSEVSSTGMAGQRGRSKSSDCCVTRIFLKEHDLPILKQLCKERGWFKLFREIPADGVGRPRWSETLGFPPFWADFGEVRRKRLCPAARSERPSPADAHKFLHRLCAQMSFHDLPLL